MCIYLIIVNNNNVMHMNTNTRHTVQYTHTRARAPIAHILYYLSVEVDVYKGLMSVGFVVHWFLWETVRRTADVCIIYLFAFIRCRLPRCVRTFFPRLRRQYIGKANIYLHCRRWLDGNPSNTTHYPWRKIKVCSYGLSYGEQQTNGWL